MKNFINLTHNEKIMVLKWRNDKRIRDNMFSSDIISLDNHLNFINKLENDKKNTYFLIDDLGVIYFNNIQNNKAEIGLYSNPKKYGIGKLLMDKIVSSNFDYLYLEVLESNKKAIELYLKYNFKIKNNKIVKGKKIISMELQR